MSSRLHRSGHWEDRDHPQPFTPSRAQLSLLSETDLHTRPKEVGGRAPPFGPGACFVVTSLLPHPCVCGGWGVPAAVSKGLKCHVSHLPPPPVPSSQGTFNLPLHLFYWSQRQPLNTNKEFPNSLTNAPSSHMRWNLLVAPWTKVLGHWWQTSLMPFTYNSEYPHWTSCLLWFGTFRTYHSRLMYSFCCLPTFDTIFWSCPQEPFQIPGPWVVTYPVLQSTQVGFKPKPYLPQSAPSRCTPPSPAV